jgi:hypothetical protein
MRHIIHHEDGDTTTLVAPPAEWPAIAAFALRCAAAVAHENVPDARWALKVLAKYGHLVPHEADAVAACDRHAA